MMNCKTSNMPINWSKLIVFLVAVFFTNSIVAVTLHDNIFRIEDPKNNPKSLLLMNSSTEDDFGDFDDFDNFDDLVVSGCFIHYENLFIK